MRIVFIGAVEFSRRTLECLLEFRANVVGVCTLKHSGANADHSDLRVICMAHGIPWTYTPDINSDDTVQWVANRQPDIIFCFGWSRLLREQLLNLAPMGRRQAPRRGVDHGRAERAAVCCSCKNQRGHAYQPKTARRFELLQPEPRLLRCRSCD